MTNFVFTTGKIILVWDWETILKIDHLHIPIVYGFLDTFSTARRWDHGTFLYLETETSWHRVACKEGKHAPYYVAKQFHFIDFPPTPAAFLTKATKSRAAFTFYKLDNQRPSVHNDRWQSHLDHTRMWYKKKNKKKKSPNRSQRKSLAPKKYERGQLGDKNHTTRYLSVGL